LATASASCDTPTAGRSPRSATSICGGGSASTSLRRDPPGQHVLDPAHHTHLGFNSGVSIEVVRRLGHASTETTQIYAELADQVADAEIRPRAAGARPLAGDLRHGSRLAKVCVTSAAGVRGLRVGEGSVGAGGQAVADEVTFTGQSGKMWRYWAGKPLGTPGGFGWRLCRRGGGRVSHGGQGGQEAAPAGST
jgi:hypothetical protein